MANGTNQERSSPGLYTLLSQIADGLATRLQIASIELSVARDNAGKAAFYGILAGFFGLFSLVFISIALLVVFWDEHRVFVACALAVFYTVIFLYLLGRARNFASTLPYSFAESKQIMQADMNSFRGALKRSQGSTPEEAPAAGAAVQTKEADNAGK